MTAHPYSAYTIGVVSGSGINLRAIFDEIVEERSFAELVGVDDQGIAGHDGLFIFGRCAGVGVILQSGRIHLYEGHSPEKVASTVDAFHGFGVRELLLTNAVGGLDASLPTGGLVAVERVETWRYTPCTLPAVIEPEVLVPGCDALGSYVWMHGPCYETRAEIRALQHMGATVVGMSLPVELERCATLGIATGVVSCVTNDCTRPGTVLTHDDVLATAMQASNRLATLLRNYIGTRRP